VQIAGIYIAKSCLLLAENLFLATHIVGKANIPQMVNTASFYAVKLVPARVQHKADIAIQGRINIL
jgi:hypothetical protein